ncbi:MAG: PAS domain S-box protein [Nitrospirae bacterium]|nr:PAS domain S-box protein [Nitrospirota bacterium]
MLSTGKPEEPNKQRMKADALKQDWKSILDGIADMITVHDGDFNISYANKTAEKILGLPSLNGKKVKCHKYYHGKNSPIDGCPGCKCIETGKPAEFKLFEPHLNMFLEIKTSPQFNDKNKLTGLIHIARDVTAPMQTEEELKKHRVELMKLVEERTAELTVSNELLGQEIIDRRQAEQLLRASEKKYRDLYDNAPDMYHSLDKNKIITDCNETEARMLGCKKEEIIGRPLADFFDEESKKLLEKDFPRLKREKTLINVERTFVRRDGTTFPAIINVFAEFNDKGELVGARAIARDISEIKKDRDARKLAEAEVVRSSQLAAVGELAAGIAHEINNPVNGILNYAQILANKSWPGSKEQDITKRIIKESDRIANIVKNLLSFTRYTDSEKIRVHLSDLLSEVLALTRTQLGKEGIKLKVNMPQGLPVVSVIPWQIEQVFLNIISNARYALNQKYQAAHDEKIFEITGEKVAVDRSRYVRIIFHDRGVGIPAGVVDKVMNPFFSTKPANIGTGLGLSVSHGIIGNHGGRISVESVKDEFTKVILELPVEK